MNYIEFYRDIALYDECKYEKDINIIEEQLEKLTIEYLEKMESIKPRLTRKINKYLFENGGFHDFSFIDMLVKETENKKGKIKVNVTLILKDYEGNVYRLEYRDVQKLNIDSPTVYKYGIDQWDRSMLDIIEKEIFKHQILFQSHTIITIEFKKLFLHVNKVSKIEE